MFSRNLSLKKRQEVKWYLNTVSETLDVFCLKMGNITSGAKDKVADTRKKEDNNRNQILTVKRWIL